MDTERRAVRRRIAWLRSSNCTPVRLERHRRALIRGWRELIHERGALAREKAAWFRPYGSGHTEKDHPGRRFCFVPRRMRLRWREADRRNDTSGRCVDVCVGSTEARKRWFGLLRRVVLGGEVVRVRHRSFDEPVLLVAEEHYRDLERKAVGGGGQPR